MEHRKITSRRATSKVHSSTRNNSHTAAACGAIFGAMAHLAPCNFEKRNHNSESGPMLVLVLDPRVVW